MPLSAGDRLGPYEVISAIGKGGMGEVWKARDPRLGRDVAIKVSARQFSDRFEREARAIAALNHSNICTLYDVGPNYLVLELIEGPTLADRIQQGPLPLEEALPIARQIADALEAAHDKGIVHRDLKPANVKIRPDGSVKVLDFGLAKTGEAAEVTADSPTLLSIPGMIMGTAGYMSPEQARGQNVDKRADIWAFGVVVYEMLTGSALFQGETVSDILVELLGREPDLGALPPQIRAVVERCLRKDSRKRWQAIGDARIALEEAEAVPESAQPGAPVEVRRSILPWAVAGALLLVAVGTLLIAVRAARTTAGSGDAPLMRFDADLGQDAVVSTTYSASLTTISPDGARLVYAARGPDGKQMLAARLLSQPGGILLSGTENGFDPFFSPDGQWIGFFADGKLKKTSVNGSAPVTLCDAEDPRGASWGDDGTIVAALTNTAGLFRVPASGGAPQQLTQIRAGEATHRWPQVLPGGQSVLFTSSASLSKYENANIEILDYKSGKRTLIQQGGYFGRYLASGHVVYMHEGVLFALPVAGPQLKPQAAPLPVLQDVASITTTGAGQFDASRNGVFVYRSGKAGPQIWSLVGLEESAGVVKMSPMLGKPGAYYTPRFSPDGKRLAMGIESGSGLDISVYDLQNDVLSRLTFNGLESFNPVWTLDGRHIAFYSRTGNSNGIAWVRSDGSGGAQPLITGNTPAPYSLSPDGRRLAYYDENPKSQFETWILPLDPTDPDHPKPGKPERFAPSQANQMHPAFSPDGRWMAYTSDESGSFEVYVRPFPETTAGGKWQISSGGGQMPVWSRDGKNLFFETLDNRIAVAGYTVKGDTFQASKPLVWFDKQIYAPTSDGNFDVAPDGRRIVAMMPQQLTGESGGAVHVTFLLNFFDELRRRVPVGK
jgi:Tol biopolymer transport system component/tRNA A-37 threonylcarbamoyl transferase component Bud32